MRESSVAKETRRKKKGVKKQNACSSKIIRTRECRPISPSRVSTCFFYLATSCQAKTPSRPIVQTHCQSVPDTSPFPSRCVRSTRILWFDSAGNKALQLSVNHGAQPPAPHCPDRRKISSHGARGRSRLSEKVPLEKREEKQSHGFDIRGSALCFFYRVLVRWCIPKDWGRACCFAPGSPGERAREE